MDLQNTFYVLAIIYMVLGIVILIGIGVGIFFIKKKIDEIQKMIQEKINAFSQPAEMAMNMGSVVAGAAIEKVKSMISGRKKSR